MTRLFHPVVNVERYGQYLEVKVKVGYDTVDVQEFNVKTEKGQRLLFDYVVKKLGIDFKKYQKQDEMELI